MKCTVIIYQTLTKYVLIKCHPFLSKLVIVINKLSRCRRRGLLTGFLALGMECCLSIIDPVTLMGQHTFLRTGTLMGSSYEVCGPLIHFTFDSILDNFTQSTTTIGRNKLNNLEFYIPWWKFYLAFWGPDYHFSTILSLLGGNKFEKWPSTVTPQVR